MARRSGLAASLARAAREMERAQRQAEQRHRQALREDERRQRDAARARAADDKERKRLHLEQRQADVDATNAELEIRVQDLQGLLATTLGVDDHIDFEQLKEAPEIPPFDPGPIGAPEPPPPPLEALLPAQPSGAKKLIPGAKARWEAEVARIELGYPQQVETHAARERERQDQLAKLEGEYAQYVAAIRERATEQNAAIDEFKLEFDRGDPSAVVSYFDMVLQASIYPDGFPQHFRLAYVPESKQLVIEYELPTLDIVPTVRTHKFVKTRDEITETARPKTEIRLLYRQVISQIPIRTIHEVFEADRAGTVETIVFNGYVATTDPATGQDIKPTLITLRTTRSVFEELNLAAVDPEACLKHLSASVSKKPEELAPVRPVLEFDMVDSRFVEESDVISGLDTRSNLMELTPTEFEGLIQNLFQAMGLETKQTRPSRDGGVDCVAFDPRPIFGGKVVIQAKRYKNTVGVSAVRDLYGTLQNEGASKGILVTTSGYGQASFEFANNKPIELIDGSNLLYLLADHLNVEARIVPPEDWTDPIADG